MIADLIPKNPDGSLTGSGWFVIAVGAWMAIGGARRISKYLPQRLVTHHLAVASLSGALLE